MEPEEVEERVYLPPARFDTAIGYWTGEPDEEALERAISTAERRGTISARCAMGHLHVRGPRAALGAAEAAIVAIGAFRRLDRCDVG